MPTHAEVAARLLRSAAVIFDEAGKQNPPLRAQMAQNRRAYEAVAILVEKDPLGEAPADPGADAKPN